MLFGLGYGKAWGLALVAGFVACLCLALALTHSRALRAEKGRAEAEVQLKALGDLVSRQNAAIEASSKEAARLATEASAATRRAASIQREAQRRIAALQTAPVPQDCHGAFDWLQEQGAALGKRFEGGSP